MTISEAFDTFKSELELPDRKQAEVSAAQQHLREQVAKNLYIADSFLTGSYARHTKIFPLNDVDVFLVRNQQRVNLSPPGTGGTLPNTALDEVVAAVPKGVTLNRRSAKTESLRECSDHRT